MNITFLLGNGFDKNCGIKSSYVDMYDGYISSSSSSDAIVKFKKNIGHDIELWSDFEIAAADYAKKVSNQEEFLECIWDFKDYLSNYLFEEEMAFRKRIGAIQDKTPIIEELNKSLNEFYKGCAIPRTVTNEIEKRFITEGITVYVINFNYTHTFEYILNCKKKNNIFDQYLNLHIHGELGTDKMLIGVDDIRQLDVKYKIDRRMERAFVKTIFNSENDNDIYEMALGNIVQADIICSFGMSFGESDYSWRQKIIKNMEAQKEKVFFLFDYEMSTKNLRWFEQKENETENARERLPKKWQMDISSDVLERIFIPCGKNIFNFDEVLKKVGH